MVLPTSRGGLTMSDYDRKEVKIDKSDEPRKPGISKMIGEGGLGADKYYNIKKEDAEAEENKNTKDK